MTVRIVHKNSETEDKRPTAGQLAKGEIAVNLNAAGAFLTVKDTAGNVQQVGGVKVSATSPNDPIRGSLWVDSSNNRLYVYDGTNWLLVTGAGGGNGGSGGVVDEVVAGDGLTGGGSNSIVTLNVGQGNGINVTANAIAVQAKPSSGIAVDGTGVGFNAGDGIAIDGSNRAKVDLLGGSSDNDKRVGLELTATDGTGKLQGKIASSTSLGVVKIGSTLTIDVNGEINGGIASPLKYRGNLNISTNGTLSAEPDTSASKAGDSYTASQAGPVAGVGETTNWDDLLKAPHATSVAVGDLIICNTDGGGSGGWTLVPVGGNNFWSLSGTDLTPKDNSYVIRANTLTSDTLTGTGTVLADANGRLVRAAPGSGLTISSGKLQLSDAGPFIKTEDGGTQQEIWSAGLKLKSGPTGARTTPFDFDLSDTSTPVLKMQAGGTGQSGSMQLSLNNQAAVGSRGLYFEAGNTSNTFGSIVSKGQTTAGGASATSNWLRYTVGDGGSALSPFTAWNDGSIEFSGNLRFRSTGGSSPFLLNISATPTASYNIALPPTAPTGNDQVLQILDNTADPKTTKWGTISAGSTPGAGTLAIKTSGEGATATQSPSTFNANTSDNVTITLPQIRYQDISGTPTAYWSKSSSGNDRIYPTSTSDNVVIGATTDYDVPLAVVKSSSRFLFDVTASSGYPCTTRLDDDGYNVYVGTKSRGLYFNNNNSSDAETTRLAITSLGRVGVNIKAPDYLFQVDNGTCGIDVPSDFWTKSTDFYDIGYGNLSSQHSYAVHLTCNGYRTSTSSQWESLGVNGKAGASQIGLHPEGFIAFNVDDNLSDGDSAIITEAARIHTNGYFGINNTSPATPLDVNGTIKGVANNIVSGAAPDFKKGNFWTVPSSYNSAVFSPTNAVTGTSGLFYIGGWGASATWGGNYKWPDGKAPATITTPAIIPFYVVSDSIIFMGKPIEDIK